MKKIFFFISLVILSFIFSGCAFTVHKTQLDYAYSGKAPQKNEKLSKSTMVGNFTDLRGTSTPNMIVHMRNGHGVVTSGGYEAEKPISVIVKEAVTSGLNQAGLINDSSSNYLLTGEIESFGISAKAEKIYQLRYRGILSVKIQLTDIKTNKIIFRDTFSGDGYSSEDTSGIQAIVKETFIAALNDLVGKLIADQFFIQQFEK